MTDNKCMPLNISVVHMNDDDAFSGNFNFTQINQLIEQISGGTVSDPATVENARGIVKKVIDELYDDFYRVQRRAENIENAINIISKASNEAQEQAKNEIIQLQSKKECFENSNALMSAIDVILKSSENVQEQQCVCFQDLLNKLRNEHDAVVRLVDRMKHTLALMNNSLDNTAI